MNDLLEYKGYHAKIEFVAESRTLRGKIEGINDYVDFESDDPGKIEAEFHAAVDDYLLFCAEVGKDPEKEYKGCFNVRVTPELHRRLARFAMKNDTSVNAVVKKALEDHLINSDRGTDAPTRFS